MLKFFVSSSLEVHRLEVAHFGSIVGSSIFIFESNLSFLVKNILFYLIVKQKWTDSKMLGNFKFVEKINLTGVARLFYHFRH